MALVAVGASRGSAADADHSGSINANKSVGTALVAAMNSRQTEAFGALLQSDVRWHIPASSKRAGLGEVVVGRDTLVGMVSAAYGKHYKEWQLAVEHILGEGDFVAMICRASMTTYTDKHAEVEYGYFFHLRAGLIAEAWELTDTATLFELLSI
jgi:ketosteroid isomerase-like protein